MNKPPATLALAVLAIIAAVIDGIITLQFLNVIPWGERALEFWGGRWVGAFLYGGLTVITALVAWGWLTLKPWAFTITVILALSGLSIPITSLMAGTETWSTAILPIIVYGLVLLLTLSRDTREATKPVPAG